MNAENDARVGSLRSDARVPRLGAARLGVWCVLAAVVLAAGRTPAFSGAPVFVSGDSGCRLDYAGSAPACDCADLSGLQRRLFGWPIPLNAARPRDLEALPRIGPARAYAIVADRERRGFFGRVEDLARVRGLGEKTVEILRPLLMVSGPDPACAPGESVAVSPVLAHREE